jgi:hypothetical protein
MTGATEVDADSHQLVFVGGLHRSGTSFIARMLSGHPAASGLTHTGAIENEGQLIQDVYSPASRHGGPGNFAFAPAMHLVEQDAGDAADRRAKARRLLECWSPYWDLGKKVLVEKSPPNLTKTLYLQALFPGAHFVLVTRHPIAVSLATAKWSRTSRYSLVAHWVKAHEIMHRDASRLERVLTVRYEDVVADPQAAYAGILEFLGLEQDTTDEPIRTGVNEKYFEQWQSGGFLDRRSGLKAAAAFGDRVRRLGYSLAPPYTDGSEAAP